MFNHVPYYTKIRCISNYITRTSETIHTTLLENPYIGMSYQLIYVTGPAKIGHVGT